MVNLNEDKCAHGKFYGNMPDYAKHLRTFVEMGVVHSITTVKAKLEYRGMTCIFLHYGQKYTSGTYHMFNLRMKGIVLIRDIIWINKTYGEYVSIK